VGTRRGRAGERRGRAAVACAIAVAFGAAGCIVHHHHPAPAPAPKLHAHRHGPPPHAPAHGSRYRHPRDGVELVFDSGLGVYVVVDWPETYWHVDHYLRWSNGTWSASGRLDLGWAVVASDQVPTGLLAKHANGSKRGKHSKHGWPAKHDD